MFKSATGFGDTARNPTKKGAARERHALSRSAGISNFRASEPGPEQAQPVQPVPVRRPESEQVRRQEPVRRQARAQAQRPERARVPQLVPRQAPGLQR
jgi:hypothetical protein